MFRVTPLGYETAGLGGWLTPYTIENYLNLVNF